MSNKFLRATVGMAALSRFHADERGSISFATVFAVLLLTMLLGMVINTGRQIDNKVKLQNAADASTYSGGVVLARGMNSLAFSNHMLCEVFAPHRFLPRGPRSPCGAARAGNPGRVGPDRSHAGRVRL